jgi:hypothetical protein
VFELAGCSVLVGCPLRIGDPGTPIRPACQAGITYHAAMPAADSASTNSANQRAEVIDLAAIVITAGLLFFVLTDLTGAPRVLFTAAFTFFAPGRAVVSNWSQMAVWADLAMSIAISLGLLALLAMIALWLRAWHPESLFVAEALLSLAGLGIGFTRRRRSHAAEPI